MLLDQQFSSSQVPPNDSAHAPCLPDHGQTKRQWRVSIDGCAGWICRSAEGSFVFVLSPYHVNLLC